MTPPHSHHGLRASDACLDTLQRVLSHRTDARYCPRAAHITHEVPVYDCADLRSALDGDGDGSVRSALLAEWAWVWEHGPGILVLQGALNDGALVDAVTGRFQEIIERERHQHCGGDHFAQAGANDRVWNALEKLCLLDPALFARYYASDMIALACLAWLGPGYQITSQVNNVRPGGAAQSPHRDYHLGFCTPDQAELYPAHVHRLSPLLTLQGAVAHVDMPLESGPTLYLPHSQKFEHGYLVAERADFRAYFEKHRVELPLAKGDAVFFNPALLHAAGHNRSTGIQRMANLLQISSAFGRAMEAVDRQRMSEALYPHLLAMRISGELSAEEAARAVAASAEGYAFPTNLDRDPPLGGLAPDSPKTHICHALTQSTPAEQLVQQLDQLAARRLTASPEA